LRFGYVGFRGEYFTWRARPLAEIRIGLHRGGAIERASEPELDDVGVCVITIYASLGVP